MTADDRQPPTTRCGYCGAAVTADDAPTHWRRGWVSRCRLRKAQP